MRRDEDERTWGNSRIIDIAAGVPFDITIPQLVQAEEPGACAWAWTVGFTGFVPGDPVIAGVNIKQGLGQVVADRWVAAPLVPLAVVDYAELLGVAAARVLILSGRLIGGPLPAARSVLVVMQAAPITIPPGVPGLPV